MLQVVENTGQISWLGDRDSNRWVAGWAKLASSLTATTRDWSCVVASVYLLGSARSPSHPAFAQRLAVNPDTAEREEDFVDLGPYIVSGRVNDGID